MTKVEFMEEISSIQDEFEILLEDDETDAGSSRVWDMISSLEEKMNDTDHHVLSVFFETSGEFPAYITMVSPPADETLLELETAEDLYEYLST